MKTNKHIPSKMDTPNSKLQKSSVIFMQLGLILALFVAYLAMEYKTTKKDIAFFEPDSLVKTEVFIAKEYEIIPKKQPKLKIVKKVVAPTKKINTNIDKIELIDNNQEKQKEQPELFADDPETDNPVLSENQITEVVEPIENKDPVDFVKIEIKPTFLKCQNKKGDQRDKCFIKNMQKHVKRNFNQDLAADLGLPEGKHRIYVQFVIDKNGDIVNVHSNATHPRLKKEAERVVKKLPQMIPGKQRNSKVPVKFNLPINFFVEY